MSAIEASSVRVNTLADGTLRITLDIEPRNALAAFTLFGAPGTPLALAALRTQAEPKKPPKPVLHSQWLAMRCEDEDFQMWVEDRWGATTTGLLGEPTAKIVRRVLGVKSRAEIDTDHEAFERFERLIRKPWAEHNQPA
jgi:hypothetical protein